MTKKKYEFEGIVHPERAKISFSEISNKFKVEDVLSAEYTLRISDSKILVTLETNSEIDIYTLKNYVMQLVSLHVDAYGFASGGGYDVEIIS